MQVRGGTLSRLGPGQVFYESPEDVHTVSRNASKTKPAKFVVFFIKNEGAPNVEARLNSKAAQLRENGTEIVRLFARFALGASFLSAVADRFGLFGPYGAKNVSWGNFARFVEYTGRGDVSLPKFIDSIVCVGSYHRGDTLWDITYRRLQNTNGLRPLRSSPF